MYLAPSWKFIAPTKSFDVSLLISLALATGPKPIMQCDACKRHFTKPHYLFVHKQLHEVGAGVGELKV